MENLRKLRQEMGLSQQAFGELFHITQQGIHKYEAGLAEPDIHTLMAFADFFHTTVDDLIDHKAAQDRAAAVEPLSVFEKQLIRDFRTLNPQIQDSLRELVHRLGANAGETSPTEMEL